MRTLLYFYCKKLTILFTVRPPLHAHAAPPGPQRAPRRRRRVPQAPGGEVRAADVIAHQERDGALPLVLPGQGQVQAALGGQVAGAPGALQGGMPEVRQRGETISFRFADAEVVESNI